MPSNTLAPTSVEDPYIFYCCAPEDTEEIEPMLGSLRERGFKLLSEADASGQGKTLKKMERDAQACLVFATPLSVSRANVRVTLKNVSEQNRPLVVCLMGLRELPADLENAVKNAEKYSLMDDSTWGRYVNRVAEALDRHMPKPPKTPEELAVIKKRKIASSASLGLLVFCGIICLGLLGYRLMCLNIPNVVGEEAAAGQELVEKKGIACEVVSDYSDEYPYGEICSQSEDGLILRFDSVTLTVSLGPGEDLYEIPDLVSGDIFDGAETLIDNGVERFTVVPVTGSGSEAGVILSQSLPAGQLLSRDIPLTLYVAADDTEPVALIKDRVFALTSKEEFTFDYAELPGVQTEFPGQDYLYRILPESELGKMGFSGQRAEAIYEFFLYGGELRNSYADCTVTKESGRRVLFLPDSKEVIDTAEFAGASELAGLPNLLSLVLSGIEGLSLEPIAGLQKLEFLDVSGSEGIDLSDIISLESLVECNIAWTKAKNLTQLKNLPKLETVFADSSMRSDFDSMGSLPFEVIYLDTEVNDLDALQAALRDSSVLNIYISGNMVLAEDEELTVNPYVCVSGADSMIMNLGTITVRGTWEPDTVDLENLGTIVVEEGGTFSGSGGVIFNYHEFTVREGAVLTVERGQSFRQYQGSFVNEGLTLVRDNGDLRYSNGSIVNHGEMLLDVDGFEKKNGSGFGMNIDQIEGEKAENVSTEKQNERLAKIK